MGKIFGQLKGDLFHTSEVYLLRAIALSPKNIAAYKDLGVLYRDEEKLQGKTLEMFNKAAELDPDDQQVKQNINITNHFIEQGGRK